MTVMVPTNAKKSPCLTVRVTPGRRVLIASIKISFPNEACFQAACLSRSSLVSQPVACGVPPRATACLIAENTQTAKSFIWNQSLGADRAKHPKRLHISHAYADIIANSLKLLRNRTQITPGKTFLFRRPEKIGRMEHGGQGCIFAIRKGNFLPRATQTRNAAIFFHQGFG